MLRSEPVNLRFVEAIIANSNVRAFRRLGSRGNDPHDWQLEPLDTDVLRDDDNGGLFVISALNVLPDGRTNNCFMDIMLPERINDYVYFVERGNLRYDYRHEFAGDIIPAIAIDCFGVYELFYSKTMPEIGIDVLKRGLAISIRKHFIAEDLGYIYRDEKRYREAAEMFQLAVDEEVSSYFIYGELAQAYAQIGETQKANLYMERFKQCGRPRK